MKNVWWRFNLRTKRFGCDCVSTMLEVSSVRIWLVVGGALEAKWGNRIFLWWRYESSNKLISSHSLMQGNIFSEIWNFWMRKLKYLNSKLTSNDHKLSYIIWWRSFWWVHYSELILIVIAIFLRNQLIWIKLLSSLAGV